MNKPNDDELVAMQCMPEQIYLGWENKKYSYMLFDGTYQEIHVTDPQLLNLLDQLQKTIENGYVVSQFLACHTKDNRFIVKYNAILNGEATDGWSLDTKIVAYFAQIFPDGRIQNVAYIPLHPFEYCRDPLQLTKNNIFYYSCGIYENNSRMVPPHQNYLYKIDMNKLDFTILSHCVFSNLTATCEK